MKNKSLILGFVVIAILAAFLVGAGKSKEKSEIIQDPPLENDAVPSDLNTVNSAPASFGNIPTYQGVKPDLGIDSLESLKNYKAQKEKDTADILASSEYENYPAIITFTKKISASSLKELKDRHNLDIIMVRYSSTVGGGEIPYQMIEDENALKIWEDKIAADQKRDNNINDFKLIDGFTAMRVSVKKDEVSQLQKEENVFLVDLGPKELYNGDASAAKSKPWRDVAYFVDLYKP